MDSKENQERESIILEQTKIKVKWHDGEHLSGYKADGQGAKLLEELGLAFYIPGWGINIDERLIEALGTEFTYQQAKEYIQPIHDKIAKRVREVEKELTEKFTKAKATNEMVLITTYKDNKYESKNWGIYAMPDGKIRTFIYRQ